MLREEEGVTSIVIKNSKCLKIKLGLVQIYTQKTNTAQKQWEVYNSSPIISIMSLFYPHFFRVFFFSFLFFIQILHVKPKYFQIGLETSMRYKLTKTNVKLAILNKIQCFREKKQSTKQNKRIWWTFCLMNTMTHNLQVTQHKTESFAFT